MISKHKAFSTYATCILWQEWRDKWTTIIHFNILKLLRKKNMHACIHALMGNMDSRYLYALHDTCILYYSTNYTYIKTLLVWEWIYNKMYKSAYVLQFWIMFTFFVENGVCTRALHGTVRTAVSAGTAAQCGLESEYAVRCGCGLKFFVSGASAGSIIVF